MHRFWLLIITILLTSAPSFGQSTPSDSQTLQSLLAEVRQLRQDLQTTTAAAQRAQILLHRLQAQEGAVVRVSQQLNEARSKLTETQTNRRRLAVVVKQNEEQARNSDNSPARRKESEELVSRLKSELDRLAEEEQQRQTRQMEVEEQLRIEQAKLDGLQEQVDRLEKSLENFGRH
jgi:DNA repair exonuclease SbcCD ATPase subunit